MILLTHPTGNAFVRALLAHLETERRLERFFTTISAPPRLGWLPARLRTELSRRAFDLPPARISAHPLLEIARLAAGWTSVDSVYRALDANAARWLERHGGVTVAYAYEDGALATFQAARRAGVHRAYELPIAYWETAQRLLREEAERLPEWAPTMPGARDSEEKNERKSAELELAETVVCPSRFVLDSLPPAALAGKNCVLAPFGSPPASTSPPMPHVAGRKLRVLFAGAMSQRKGLADLFMAMKLLRGHGVELVVMGSAISPMAFYRGQYGDFIHEPPRAREAVLALMRSCDVLALPSIVEGRALVQQEAMSCGLPLVVTRNAGGEDLIDGTGFLVPIRSPESIAAKLALLAEDRTLLAAMSAAAQHKAAAYTWQAYASKIAGALPP